IKNKPFIISLLKDTVKALWHYDRVATPVLDRTLYNTLAALLEYLDGRSLAFPVPFLWDDGEHTAPLAPDAVFAIDYGDNSFIAFALEADRNAAPHRHASWGRKSDRRTLRQYEAFIGRKLYKRAYTRDAMMMMLFIT